MFTINQPIKHPMPMQKEMQHRLLKLTQNGTFQSVLKGMAVCSFLEIKFSALWKPLLYFMYDKLNKSCGVE